MPRHDGDRPAVMPEGSVNIAFIGNFAESPTEILSSLLNIQSEPRWKLFTRF